MCRLKKWRLRILNKLAGKSGKCNDLIGRCCWNCRYRLYDKSKKPCCICNMGSEWEIDG